MNIRCTAPLLEFANMERSIEFYCEGLRFEMTESWRPDGNLRWCWLKRGDANLMLQQQADGAAPSQLGGGVTLYFLCDDVAPVYRELVERGVAASKPEVAFYGMNQTFLQDPDGYAICFESREP